MQDISQPNMLPRLLVEIHQQLKNPLIQKLTGFHDIEVFIETADRLLYLTEDDCEKYPVVVKGRWKLHYDDPEDANLVLKSDGLPPTGTMDQPQKVSDEMTSTKLEPAILILYPRNYPFERNPSYLTIRFLSDINAPTIVENTTIATVTLANGEQVDRFDLIGNLISDERCSYLLRSPAEILTLCRPIMSGVASRLLMPINRATDSAGFEEGVENIDDSFIQSPSHSLTHHCHWASPCRHGS